MTTPKLKKNITRNQAIEALWYRGVLHWKLDANQKEMHKLCHENPNKVIVLGCSRRLGKTFFLVTLALEHCLQNPNSIVKFIAPTIKDIRRIIAPLVRTICSDCPSDIMPVYKTQEHVWRFANGSEIQLGATDSGNADSIRGNDAHLCIVDEAGFCDNLAYITKGVLLASVILTGGKVIMASTPPKSMDHDFVTFMRQAQLNNAYIKKTIYDNPRMTTKQIDDLALEYGGKDSTDFRREYLVELITSDEDAIIPEFNSKTKPNLIKETTLPPFYEAYVSMDIGVVDLTVVLFAHYDFKTATVYVEDEIVMNGKEMVSDTLAARIKETEKKLWIDPISGAPKPPYMRVSDNNNLLLLNDFQIKHNLLFLPANKDNLEASLNNTRMLIKQQRVIINPRCITLINHLETGIWNKARTSFARSSDKGHFDAIHSLIYLLRHIDFTRNPYPANYDSGRENFFIRESNQASSSKSFEEGLKSMIKKGNPFRFR
jgi:hypothetical protein